MKKLILLILISPIISFSQIDTTALSFYPLRTGNIWEYVQILYDDPYYMPISSYYRYTVVGDTIFPNNKLYKVIRRKYLPTSQYNNLIFQRIDTTTCNVYEYDNHYAYDEYLLDSLKMQVWDTIYASRGIYANSTRYICREIKPDTVLGIITQTKFIEDIDFVGFHWYELTQNMGLTYYYSYEIGGVEIRLLYAKINGIEFGTPVSIDQKEIIPHQFKLYQNYSNPFNPTTTILFELPYPSKIELSLFNIKGQLIRTLLNGKYSAGVNEYKFDARGISAGIYIYTLKTAQFSQSRKCIVIH